MTTLRKIAYRCLLVLFSLLASQAPGRVALAHADLDRSDPAADALLTTAPTQVQLWFTQELFRRQGMNSIEVYAADGSRQDQGDATINDDDRTLITVALKPDLPPGVYTVRWQALSAEDGHDSAGEFTFTVETGTAVEPTAPTAAVTPTEVPTAATATPPPVATPTAVPTATPSPATGTGLSCFGVPLSFMAVGLLWASRRRS